MLPARVGVGHCLRATNGRRSTVATRRQIRHNLKTNHPKQSKENNMRISPSDRERDRPAQKYLPEPESNASGRLACAKTQPIACNSSISPPAPSRAGYPPTPTSRDSRPRNNPAVPPGMTRQMQ